MKPKFYRKVLKNGMTVVFEKRNIPIVSVAFAVRRGGINEVSKEKGISHFIEHMLYKGTTNRTSKEIAEEIERKGGILNGFTDEEITGYWCKIPSKHLNTALEVLSDIVKNPLFDEKEMEKERKVIFEEIKMRKDNPTMYVFDKVQSCLYDSPFGDSLTGTFQTVSSINKKKITEKFREIYKANNMILCVVGGANFSDIIKFAQDNFEKEKGKRTGFRVKIKLMNKSKIEKRKGIDQANLIFAYHVPIASDKRSYVAEVLSSLMTDGMSSRLFREIRDKRNLAYSIKGDSNINKNFAYNYVYIGTKKENVELVKRIILDEFEKVSKILKKKELEEVKEQLIGNHYIAMEDSQSQMASLLSYEIIGNARDFYNFEKNIKKVKLEEVKKLASEIKGKKYSFLALVPLNK